MNLYGNRYVRDKYSILTFCAISSNCSFTWYHQKFPKTSKKAPLRPFLTIFGIFNDTTRKVFDRFYLIRGSFMVPTKISKNIQKDPKIASKVKHVICEFIQFFSFLKLLKPLRQDDKGITRVDSRY